MSILGGNVEHKFLYRIFDHWMREGLADIHLDQFPIVKETPRGAWILVDEFLAKKKFVLLRDPWGRPTRKRWACETVEDAVKSFIARKQHQAGHLQRGLKQAQAALKEAMEPSFDPRNPMCRRPGERYRGPAITFD